MYCYKETELLKELPIADANFLRNSNINVNTDIVELIEQLENLMQENGVETESGKIVENIIDELNDIDLNKYYRVIFVEPDFSDSAIISALSDLNDFQIGDEVVVETKNGEVEGIVREVAYFKEKSLEYSPDVMYVINEITYRSDEKEED